MVQDIGWQQLAKRSWGHSGRLPSQDTAVTFCFSGKSGKAPSTGTYRSCAGRGEQLTSLQVLQALKDMSEARGQAGVLSHNELWENTAAQPI